LPEPPATCHRFVMISVVIPTFNNEATLANCLASLVTAAVDGIVREVILADGGSRDGTLKIADMTGADVVSSSRDCAAQLAAGAQAAKSQWLLFLPPHGTLSQGFEREAAAHMSAGAGWDGEAAIAARIDSSLDGADIPALVARAAARTAHAVLGLRMGGGGLLIARAHYAALGGFRAVAGLEDVDLMRRIGRRRIVTLRSRLVLPPGHFPAATIPVQAGRLIMYRLGGPRLALEPAAAQAGVRPAGR